MADIFNFYVYDDRSIRFELAEPIMLEDKDVTQFRFRIPKSLNGFDMSDWEWWFIFVNPNGTKYTTLLELTDDEDEPDEYSVATYTVGYGFSGIVGTVKFSIEALNVSGEEIVNEWHTKTYSTAVIDTLQGLRAVIPEPDGQAASGLTQEEKELILTLFSKAAYADDDAKLSYDQLEALWRVITRLVSLNLSHVTSSNTSASVENGSRYVTTLTADTNYSINSVTVTMGGVDVTATYYNSGTITIPSVTGDIVITASAVLAAQSITATYTQSGTVYDTDSLDSLKADLVVVATYADSSTETIASTDYTLSGTLAEGTSTITVSYAGLTDTFNVTVSSVLIYNWDFTESLTDTKAGRVAELRGTNTAPTQTSEGIVFNAATQNLNLGEIAMKGKTLEVDVASFQFAGSTSNHIRFVMCPSDVSNVMRGSGPLIYYAGYGWYGYGPANETGTSGAWSPNAYTGLSGNTDAIRNAFNGKTVKIVFSSDSNNIELFVNNESKGSVTSLFTNNFQNLVIGGGYTGWSSGNGDQCYNMTISGVRVYANEV